VNVVDGATHVQQDDVEMNENSLKNGADIFVQFLGKGQTC
jgi:hypothetical protein